jgi:hypothetical protein
MIANPTIVCLVGLDAQISLLVSFFGGSFASMIYASRIRCERRYVRYAITEEKLRVWSRHGLPAKIDRH